MRSFEIVRQAVPLMWFCFTASASHETSVQQPFGGLASRWQSELVTLLQGACDPRCCGTTTGDDRSLPCCASCDGIVSLDSVGIPFAIPAAGEQASEASNAAGAEKKGHVEVASPQSPLAITTPGLGAPILVIPKGNIPFVIRCALCKNGGLDCSDPKNCSGGGGVAIISPHYPPTFFQDDEGNWQLLLQEETNALSIKSACICGDDQISMECPCTNLKKSDVEALRKIAPKRDEL